MLVPNVVLPATLEGLGTFDISCRFEITAKSIELHCHWKKYAEIQLYYSTAFYRGLGNRTLILIVAYRPYTIGVESIANILLLIVGVKAIVTAKRIIEPRKIGLLLEKLPKMGRVGSIICQRTVTALLVPDFL